MTLLSDLAWLEAQGVVAWGQDGKLKFASEDKLSDTLREKLLDLKPSLLDFWNENSLIPRETSGLQQAYWFGENNAFNQHTPAFLHLVFAGEIPSQSELQAALHTLVQRHPPLDYTLDAEYPVFKTMVEGRNVVGFVKAKAGTSSHQTDALLDADSQLPSLDKEGPLFKLLLVDDGREVCLHGIFRLVLFDAYSVCSVVDEIIRIAKKVPLADTEKLYDASSFREFEITQKRKRAKARQYWQNKIASMPGPNPGLLSLFQKDDQQVVQPKSFKEHRYNLGVDTYANLKNKAKTYGVSVNATLISCYLATLSRWAESQKICASVMYSQRHYLPEQHQTCLGNFGNLLLLSSQESSLPISEQARLVQTDLFNAMDNSAYDGVSVIRDWVATHAQSGSAPPMPFVFSTLLGAPLQEFELEQVGHRMMTPQIWIDAQAFEDGDDLVLSWDELEDILEPGLVDQLFEYFTSWIVELSTSEEAWASANFELPIASRDLIKTSNATEANFPSISLIENILRLAQEEPNKTAIWHAKGNLTFGDLVIKASNLAAYLNENGVGPGDNVVVVGQRDPDVIIAIYAILMAGATFVPVVPSMPSDKIKRIVTQAAATTILADKTIQIDEICASPVMWTECYSDVLENLPADSAYMEPAYPIDPAQLAYIIFTSGSTGVPKGVAVTHSAAINTLQSCIRLFDLEAGDRLLATSELNFDLSIFDIFLPAIIGCSTIFVDSGEHTDPAVWVAAANEYQATVWNSVPAVIEMAALYCDDAISSESLPNSLRLFMASGDWVPLHLPSTIKNLLPSSTFVALGGATEAAIWSNYYIVEEENPAWRSIPYGTPLDNQQFYILDDFGELCPQGVAGTLHIGGAGLAECYINDIPQTAARFSKHETLNKRLYNTGDMGRYLKSGDIEFLGRQDHQVKINGFRVELSEIEHFAVQHDSIKAAVAIFSREDDGILHLAYVPESGGAMEPTLTASALKEHLSKHLNSYMIPQRFHHLDKWPLSDNGKVDRKALLSLVKDTTKGSENSTVHADNFAKEPLHLQKLFALVHRVLPAIENSNQDWFQMGCNSLQALHLLHAVNSDFGTRFQLPDIYQARSVQGLSKIMDGSRIADGNVVWLHKSPQKKTSLVIFVHPVGGSVACYLEAAAVLQKTSDVMAFCARDDDEVPSIPELAKGYLFQIEDQLEKYEEVVFGGWSLGGSVALEMVKASLKMLPNLQAKVVTIDSYVGSLTSEFAKESLFKQFLIDLERTQSAPLDCKYSKVEDLTGILQARFETFQKNYSALTKYYPEITGVDIVCFQASLAKSFNGLMPLSKLVDPSLVTPLGADHYTVLEQPFFERWIAEFVTDQRMPLRKMSLGNA